MNFPLFFQNVIWPGGHLFSSKKMLKKPNTWECAQVLVVTWVKLDCVKALLSPDPTSKANYCRRVDSSFFSDSKTLFSVLQVVLYDSKTPWVMIFSTCPWVPFLYTGPKCIKNMLLWTFRSTVKKLNAEIPTRWVLTMLTSHQRECWQCWHPNKASADNANIPPRRVLTMLTSHQGECWQC